jgi:ABC-2 type transport system ATP-binding protein
MQDLPLPGESRAVEGSMISCSRVAKTYVVRERAGLFRRGARREIEALHGIELEIAQGEFVGLLGRNGAGKTTLLKIVATLLLPTTGQVEVGGVDALRKPTEVRRQLGVVLAGERTLYWKLTARENLLLFGGLHDLPRREARARSEDLLKLVGLSDFTHVSVEKFSSGMRKRLAIARALIHRPPVLILDEPTTGLDPHGVEGIWDVLRALQEEGTTVLMATHNMLEAGRLPTRLLIIEEGKLLADGTPEAITARSGAGRTAVLTLGSRPKVNEGFLVHELESGRYSLAAPVDRLPGLLGELQADGVHLANVEIVESGLWEAFLRLTGRPFDNTPAATEDEE